MKLSVIFGIFFLSSSAWAQSCGGGIPAGAPGCIPPDNPASPYSSEYGSSAQPAAPRMIWADRWGAIAIDTTMNKGGIGTVVGMSSKRAAIKAALAQCHVSGGGDGCKVYSSYENGCGALSWGNNSFVTAHAPSIEEASALATQGCSKETTDCQIYYADCSMAERIQ